MALPYEVVKTSDHDEWLNLRMQGIGGSDVAAIMGLSKYRSPLEVWLEKTGRVAPADLSDNEAVYWGVKLEPIVRETFAAEHPELKVEGPLETLVSVERPWAHANLDGVVTESDGSLGVLEIKTVGKAREADWADGVPDYYFTQVTHYLSVTGWTYAWVAALIGGQHYVEFRVERDEEDIRVVSDCVDEFWNGYVLAGVMPEIVGTDGERVALFDVYQTATSDAAEVTEPDAQEMFDALVRQYREDCELESHARAAKQETANWLRLVIGDHGSVRSGAYSVTWSRYGKTVLDVRRLRSERPDIYAAYCETKPWDGGIRVRELS